MLMKSVREFCVCAVCEHRVQNEVDEVVDIMQSNIGRVMDRGERLEDLHDKSGESCIQLAAVVPRVFLHLLSSYELSRQHDCDHLCTASAFSALGGRKGIRPVKN